MVFSDRGMEWVWFWGRSGWDSSSSVINEICYIVYFMELIYFF